MAFHFYVMNNILYLIEFVLSDRILPSLPSPLLLLPLSSHHVLVCLVPTTRRRLFTFAHTIWSTKRCEYTYSIYIVLFISFRHRVFGRSFVSFLALVLNQSSSSLYFHTKLMLVKFTISFAMCVHGMCKRHITASFSSIVLWSFPFDPELPSTNIHMHILHMLKVK